MLQFAAAREDDQIEVAAFPFRDVTATQHSFATQFWINVVQYWNGLTREREQSRSIGPLHRRCKCACGFFRVSRPNHVDVRNQANGADGLDRFMRRAVLADADRVVGKNVNVGKLRECTEPNGSAAIIGKHHERRTRGTEQPMI